MPRKPNEIDWAWFAGVFEGEGSISWTGKNSVELRICMTDEDVVERIYEIAGGRFYRQPERHDRPENKPVYRWRMQKADEVLVVLGHIEQHLGKRRWSKAQEAKIRLARVQQEGICKRGHDLNETRYTAPNGSTECGVCRNERARMNYHKRKESV